MDSVPNVRLKTWEIEHSLSLMPSYRDSSNRRVYDNKGSYQWLCPIKHVSLDPKNYTNWLTETSRHPSSMHAPPTFSSPSVPFAPPPPILSFSIVITTHRYPPSLSSTLLLRYRIRAHVQLMSILISQSLISPSSPTSNPQSPLSRVTNATPVAILAIRYDVHAHSIIPDSWVMSSTTMREDYRGRSSHLPHPRLS